MAYLWKKSVNKGWLRQLEARLTGRKLEGKPKDEEKNLAVKLFLSLLSCTGSAKLIATQTTLQQGGQYSSDCNAPVEWLPRKGTPTNECMTLMALDPIPTQRLLPIDSG